METNAPEVSASQILGGSPPPKKSRPPLPPGVTVKPVYPGASYGIHPVDKMGIKLTDAKLLETPLAGGSKPPELEPQPPTTPTTPAPAPDPTPQPEIKTESQPTGAAPDFSDLPNGDGGAAPGTDQEKEPTHEEVLSAYAQMAGMCFDSVIVLFCILFGDFWQPKTADERKMVIGAIVAYFDSIVAPVLTPLQNLWMAIGFYCMPRIPQSLKKIWAWWKARGKKKPEPETEPRRRENQPDIDAETGNVWKAPLV
jgi:hypothetical protein